MYELAWRDRAIVVLLAMVASAGFLGAQSSQEPKPAPPAPSPNGTVSSVQIQRENVFDKAERERWLARVMNGLHIVTREPVVAREMLFRQGQPFDSTEFAETARNLRKLDVFRAVSVDSATTDSGLVALVTTRDAWTTQPYATFKSAGDQITWGIGMREKNLLGLGIKAGVRYTSDPDRSTTSFTANLPRILQDRVDFSGSYDLLSDGERGRFTVAAPYTALTTPRSASFEWLYDDIDILRFYNGEEAASDTVRRLMSSVTLRGGRAKKASRVGYLRTGLALRARRDDFRDLTEPEIAKADRSVFGDLEMSLESSSSKYLVIRGYRNLVMNEDVDLSRTIRVSLWVAPSALGYERTGFGPAMTMHTGRQFSKGFTYSDLRASSLFTSSGLDSGSVAGLAVLLLHPAPRHAVVFNVNAGMQKNAHPGAEFDLGLTFGPRGFPAHSFTGDRAFFTTAEYRWLAIPDIMGLVAVGLAGFADYGGAWYSGSPSRTGTDVGIGLRFGSIRGSATKGATRIDLAHRFANDALGAKWVIAIGSGFAFDRPPP